MEFDEIPEEPNLIVSKFGIGCFLQQTTKKKKRERGRENSRMNE